jgi:hypothetical protein
VRVVTSELVTLLHRDEQIAQAQRQLHDMIRHLLADGARTGELRADVAPDELAAYRLHALTAAGRLPSHAAVHGLVTRHAGGLDTATLILTTTHARRWRIGRPETSFLAQVPQVGDEGGAPVPPDLAPTATCRATRRPGPRTRRGRCCLARLPRRVAPLAGTGIVIAHVQRGCRHGREPDLGGALPGGEGVQLLVD